MCYESGYSLILPFLLYYLLGAYQNRNRETGEWSWDPFEWNDPIFSSAGFNDAAYWNGYEQAYGDVYGWDSFSEPGKPGACYYSESRRFFNWGYQDDQGRGNTFDVNAAVQYINDNAYSHYIKEKCGKCAFAVRMALETGGINTQSHPLSAKDYGPYLKDWGFEQVSPNDYQSIPGDIRVIQPYLKGSRHGHIDMYNGSHWVSDFVENGFWPGLGYRTSQPAYAIFRWLTEH